MANKSHVGPVPNIASEGRVAASRSQHDGDCDAVVGFIKDSIDRKALLFFDLVDRHARKHVKRLIGPVIDPPSDDILPMNQEGLGD